MKIWWCSEHRQGFEDSPDAHPTACNLVDPADCRMVPMRLIPDNDETVERIAAVLAKRHGLDWPIAKPDPNLLATTFTNDAEAVLAALDGETP